MQEQIDIVIPWVDGSDKKWQIKASKYLKMKEISGVHYRDYDTLKYTLRSIDKYFSWVHKIYLVTDNQKPRWINESNKKLEIIDHKDIIDEKYLPTFNSNVILMNIHKIPNLSDKFVILEDDMLITKKVENNTFFKNDLPCDFMIENALTATLNLFTTCFNAMQLINYKFNKRNFIKHHFNKYFSLKYGIENFRTILSSPYEYYTGFVSKHAALPMLKKTYKNVWDDFGVKLEENNTHKTRKTTDITNWIMRYYQLASGDFVPVSPNRYKYFNLGDVDFDKLNKDLQNQRYLSICLNDQNISDIELTKKKLKETLEQTFPKKSQFEI